MSVEDEFADLKFKIECGSMILRKSGNDDLSLSGPGEIWQDASGKINFKIFISSQDYKRLNQHNRLPVQIGAIIPEERFFSLEAFEHTSRKWTASNIIPSNRGGIEHGVAYGHLRQLVTCEEMHVFSDFDHINIRFKGKAKFPCNKGTETVIKVAGQKRRINMQLNVACYDDSDTQLEVSHEGEHTLLSMLLPAGKLNSSTASRIKEALQFTLGRQLEMMVVESFCGRERKVKLISPFSQSGATGTMQPPLRFVELAQGDHVWRIFSSYLKFIKQDEGEDRHLISRHIGSAIESTAASIEADVLALSVAVEGLVKECFPDLSSISDALSGELDSAAAAIQDLQICETTKTRVIGAINALRKTRNSDLLKAFIKKHHLPAGIYDSWSRLRNTSAHGSGIGGRDAETILRLRDEVRYLMYSIVLAAIGYVGPRTDYTTLGWPRQAWPITSKELIES